MRRPNDEERRQWIENDEGLYDTQRASGLSMREFIRQNREFLDSVIETVTSGRKPAHYLKYDRGLSDFPTYKRPAMEVIDWNHDESGGWVLYRAIKTPVSQQPVVLEWWFEPEREGAPSPTFVYEVYREDVPNDVFTYHDWVEVDQLASFLGASPEELRARGVHPEAAARASVLMDIVAYYGSVELDQYPIRLTGAEMRKRWPKIFRGLPTSVMWEKARDAALKIRS